MNLGIETLVITEPLELLTQITLREPYARQHTRLFLRWVVINAVINFFISTDEVLKSFWGKICAKYFAGEDQQELLNFVISGALNEFLRLTHKELLS